jgi:hypothetical protein
MSKQQKRCYKQTWIEATTEMLQETESLTRKQAMNKAKMFYNMLLK